MVKGYNHIGICVFSIDETAAWFGRTLGAELLYKKEYPERHQVSAMLELKDGSRIELMEPLGEGGTVNGFLEKKGQGIHHLSLKVDDLDAACRQFEEAGGKIIGRASGIAFVHPKTAYGCLLELSDGSFGKSDPSA